MEQQDENERAVETAEDVLKLVLAYEYGPHEEPYHFRVKPAISCGIGDYLQYAIELRQRAPRSFPPAVIGDAWNENPMADNPLENREERPIRERGSPEARSFKVRSLTALDERNRFKTRYDEVQGSTYQKRVSRSATDNGLDRGDSTSAVTKLCVDPNYRNVWVEGVESYLFSEGMASLSAQYTLVVCSLGNKFDELLYSCPHLFASLLLSSPIAW
ncbi:hypothetical protein AXG93_4295s1480 [Marchantia polymorpha subsp. ruderalis]|uniref:Uncharacterized protein n=1 Tax=Marchantia polymorpha subsp. ruderalis TaxID=1480154 RepID=A0A176WC21_MARPO|nr:hypothetical protein AXG93_4295s1480 [Marchantia polymorpha subsp. ruderalis]